MANAVFYSNVAQQTTLSGSISSAATSINVGATTGFPPSFPYTLALDFGAATEELVSVTAAAGTTLTVIRGYGGTSAQSHSLGAVVRHVYDATDATAFRSHEAATSAVHGVSGALVGTSDTQTLSNKTLTSPVVNGGALSGTFTGSPAFSGGLSFSGTPSFSGTATVSGTLTSSAGTLSGSWAGNPTLSGNPVFSGVPNFTGTIQSTMSAATGVAQASIVTTDTFDRYRRFADGKQEWGSGAAARDTNLYRSSASTLATDSSLAVGGSLAVTGGITAGTTTWTAFTPSWTGLGGATLNTNVGWYTKLGKLVFYEIYTVWATSGTGTTGVSVAFPTTPFRDGAGANTTRQAAVAHVAGSNGGVVDGVASMYAFASDTGTTAATLRRFDGIQIQSNNMVGGSGTNTIVTIQGWYREA
ncbi:hypothetical protein [Streptomyces misionensis]|uniref:hypothetical protein n=1 Tax=Streptomyces misionensis TaxID=67331 RepID=UPI0036AAB83C